MYNECAKCGDILSEPYGATTDNKCVKCASAERAVTQTIQAQGPSGADRRGYTRVRTLMQGVLTDRAGSLDVRINDISAGGVMITGPSRPPKNETLEIAITGAGSLHAELVWQDGMEAGLRFVESPDKVSDLMSRIAPIMTSLLR